jgi:hypothetical protein
VRLVAVFLILAAMVVFIATYAVMMATEIARDVFYG